MHLISKLKEFILEILFPSVCYGCNQAHISGSTEILCIACKDSIELSTALTCPICKGRVPIQYRNSPCHKKTDYLLASATSYENSAVRALIWQLKFRHRLSVLPELVELLNKTLKNLGIPLHDFVLIPIPLHASRLRERGFNQSELIANQIADSNHLTVDSSSLLKIKKTKAQIAMKNHKQRHSNLRGVFSLSITNEVKGKNIILIDDVWTSGATMNEASAVLQNGGAKKIIGLVVAKAG